MRFSKVVFTALITFSTPLMAQVQLGTANSTSADDVVLESDGLFKLKRSELTRFLETAYRSKVQNVSLSRNLKSYIRDNIFNFLPGSLRRDVNFTMKSDGITYEIICDLLVTPYLDVIYTSNCTSKPNAVVDDSNVDNRLSRFTKITQIKSK